MPRRRKKLYRTRQSAEALPWRRILVPIDFSKTSLRALDVAVPIARDHGARLILVAAIEPAGFVGGMESVAMVVPDATIAKDAGENLAKIAERLIPARVPVTMLVGRGRAYQVICRIANKEDIDMIVLTTHGRGGLERFLMGSTAEQVVRHARCPVFVVRPARSGKR